MSRNPPIEPDWPGADLVEKGLRDASTGAMTIEALLVHIGAPRLRRVGIDVPAWGGGEAGPERALYEALLKEHDRDAHSRYNALIRRLVSFEHAAEHAATRARRGM